MSGCTARCPLSHRCTLSSMRSTTPRRPCEGRHHRTVRERQADSHDKKGREQFTDAVIKTISQKKSGIVLILWANSAQAKTRLIDETKHHIFNPLIHLACLQTEILWMQALFTNESDLGEVEIICHR
ncbi:hypothetical protein GUJ93_ZPchr0458g22316 [Zizania palustris]|uniref:Uncharacterized protein n=1 Tax=Zizania palustris TaxID=103762 RepID=A0A8J5R7K2_ZIZPA|nr:hypothetical protein GUJ93_ZPchr0458g22316 [Zizania palustris]